VHDVQTHQAPDQGHKVKLSHHRFQNSHRPRQRGARDDVAVPDGSQGRAPEKNGITQLSGKKLPGCGADLLPLRLR
jgi:hypothetical protein